MSTSVAVKPSFQQTHLEQSWYRSAIPIILGVALYNMTVPQGLNPQGWHLFSIFIATIAGLVLKPFPMAVVALIGMMVAVLSGTLTVNQGLEGYATPVIWLVVYIFFIARGFIKTGLGKRIAYTFVSLLGHRTLGLGYGLLVSELVVAPFIPSNSARAGGLMYPILKSISESLDSRPEDGTARRLGAYLTQVVFHGNLIVSAMFLTAMAANPMAQAIAASQGIEITWGSWALAASVPGLLSIVIIPFLLYVIYPPEVKVLPHAPEMAKKELFAMGEMSRDEWIMATTFFMMLGLWIFGEAYGISNTTTALIGLCVLLISGILSWGDMANESEAWQTLAWFAILVNMGTYLDQFGFTSWFSASTGEFVSDMSWFWAFLVLVLVYFYSHYIFASNTAHVSALYAAFLSVAVAAGAPPVVAALLLGFCSSLFSSMTHYGSSACAILYGTGYVPIGTWWSLGLLVSLVNLVIWIGGGGLWWKVLGLW